MKIFKISICSIIVLFLTNCATKSKGKIAANITYEIECMGVELDGSQTLKSWGTGRNYSDACEQAKKNAVRDVLFVGIKKGRDECNALPLIMDPSGKFNNESYFNKFFADGGEYAQYVNTKDERILDKVERDKMKNDESRTHGVVVRVLRSELKTKMINDGIIK